MKTVIVLGLMNSGSGAIYDCLASRSDFVAPFGSSEFKFCSAPMGLHNLYLNFYNNFSFFNPSNAIEEFLKYSKKYQDHIVYPTYGNGRKLLKKKIYTIIESFIDKISEVSYQGNPEFSNFKINKFEDIFYRITNQKRKFYKIRIPVDKKHFLKESKILIKKIIKNNLENDYVLTNQHIILNQASNIFNPFLSSQYFENNKIIIVTRDPRDIYSSMKNRKSKGSPSYDALLFTKWFKKCFDNDNFKKVLNNKNLLVINYENFLNDFKKENKKICQFLKIKETNKINSNYEKIFDLNKSRESLYKSKKFLSNMEQNIIKKNLKRFLQW